jgi:NADPH:quinone reductase-like Zn-dependent oxidoreductase
VSYGGMSKRPLTLPFDLITYKQLKVEGFWMAAWYEARDASKKAEMMEEIINMVRNKQLSFFFEVHDFDDFHYALDKSMQQFQFRKVILNLDHPDRLVEHDALDEKEYDRFDTTVN